MKCWEGNGTARRLYERLGFKEDGLRKNYYTDPTENAVLMTKCRSENICWIYVCLEVEG